MNVTKDSIAELQKNGKQKRRVNKQHHIAVDKSTFAKENAKKNRKNDAKRIINNINYSDYSDYDDYDDEYETFERFGKG